MLDLLSSKEKDRKCVKLTENVAMATKISSIVIDCITLMLQPIVRFCLRRSVRVQDLLEFAKVVFIDVAAEEIQRSGQKVNVSRLSVMTGLHRRDVVRIYKDGNISTTSTAIPRRVIGQWEQDAHFHTKAGKPRVLTFEGEDSEFRELVRLVSTDIDSGAVLFELERTDTVKRVPSGLKLLAGAYVVSGKPKEGFQMLARDTKDLMFAIEENVLGEDDIPNLHGRTEYDNICQRDLPKIREWLLNEGTKFHKQVRDFLSKYDKDINPRRKDDGGGKVIVGTFGRVISEP